MVTEKIQPKEGMVENDLEYINQMIKDIESQIESVETTEDIHEITKKINKCNIKCSKLEYDQAEEKRKELMALSKSLLGTLERFEQENTAKVDEKEKKWLKDWNEDADDIIEKGEKVLGEANKTLGLE